MSRELRDPVGGFLKNLVRLVGRYGVAGQTGPGQGRDGLENHATARQTGANSGACIWTKMRIGLPPEGGVPPSAVVCSGALSLASYGLSISNLLFRIRSESFRLPDSGLRL